MEGQGDLGERWDIFAHVTRRWDREEQAGDTETAISEPWGGMGGRVEDTAGRLAAESGQREVGRGNFSELLQWRLADLGCKLRSQVPFLCLIPEIAFAGLSLCTIV